MDRSRHTNIPARNAETFTKTFTWTVTGEKKAVPKILSVSCTGAADEYGIYHVADGETAPTFTATASDGSTATWYAGGSSRKGSIVPEAPTAGHSILPVTLKVTQNDYTATRVFYVAFNKVFHVDASTAVAAKDQNGSAEKPWSDFYFKVAREDGTTVMMREDARYLPGDTIVVHPGTYHHPIRIMDFDGGLTIVNAEGGSSANTSLEIEREANDVYWPVTGRRAFTHAPWGLTLTTNGWKYVRVPSTNTFVRGLAIRNSSIMADRDLDVSVQGVAGGGAFGGTFLNCVFEDCVATNRGPLQAYSGYYDWEDGYGGAAYGANLINCAIVGCLADIGGAAANCRLVNCTVADNAATIAAGGLDGQCVAYNSIIRYNTCGGKKSEYEKTYRPTRLIADEPTIENCFTIGDPRFCSDYTLLADSPCIGAGDLAYYPMTMPGSGYDLAGNSRFTHVSLSLGAFEGTGTAKVALKVETVGIGTVSPDSGEVTVGASQAFMATSDRPVVGWYTNGVLVASSGSAFTWENIPVKCALKVVFGKKTIRVGPPTGAGAPYDYATIVEAVAAAGAGDTITVAAGTYAPVDASNFSGALEIRAESYDSIKDNTDVWGAAGDVIIDGGATQRCFIAQLDDESIVLRGLVLTNGYTHATDYRGADGYTVHAIGGGGLRGGRAENCTITGCSAYGRGGGSYRATLVRCRVEGNDCFQDGNKDTCYGGGAYGGALTDCRVTGNDVGSWYGSATYDAVVKNSFVWGNGSNYCTQEIVDGDHGAALYVTKKVPTAARVAAQPTKLQAPGEETRVFSTEKEAKALAAVTAVDVPSEIVANRIDVEEYVERFEVRTVKNPDGEGFINEVTLKPAEVKKVEAQVEDVLTVDDDGNARTDYTVQKMEKTLTETTPGLYYALEFSTSLSGDNFKGERHLATGNGSVKISATSTDSPSGFWRVNVYTTPDGD